MEKARGSEGGLLGAKCSGGREMEGKGNKQEQHNRVSILLGMKSGSSSLLFGINNTFAQHNVPSSAFSMQIGCQIMLLVSILPTVSLLHWVNYNQAAIAPLWTDACLHEPTNSDLFIF